MSNLGGFNTSKKKSQKWGEGGISGGGTEYEQIKIPDNFTIHPDAGASASKPNVKTDKPFNSHIDGKK